MASQKNKKQLVWLLLTALFFTQMPVNEAKAQTTLPSGTPYPAVSTAPSQMPTTTVEPNMPLYTPGNGFRTGEGSVGIASFDDTNCHAGSDVIYPVK